MEEGTEYISLGKSKYKKLFEQCDRDNSGTISLQELIEFIESDPIVKKQLPRNIIKKIYQKADTNGDGTLSYSEFLEMVQNPKLKSLFGKYLNKYVDYIVPAPRLTQIKRQESIDEHDGSGAYEEQYTCCPPSLGMIIISLIEVILFCTDEALQPGSTEYAFGYTATALKLDPSKKIEMWRYVTYMFVHVGSLHLVVNLFVQLLLGIPLEMVHGWWRILLIYFAGVVAGSVCTSVFDPNVSLAGASGGVYAIITAHIACVIMNWSEMAFPLIQMLIFLVIVIVDFGSSLYGRYYSELESQVGYAAHIGGAAAGFLIGIVILRNLYVHKAEKILQIICLAVYLVTMAAGILIIVFSPDLFSFF